MAASSQFQSTAPSQRLTAEEKKTAAEAAISIHSPIAETDAVPLYTLELPFIFQSTAPSQRLTANIPIFFTYALFFLLNYTISPYYTQVILLLIPISIKTLIILPGANLSQFSCALGIRTKVILVQKAKLSIKIYEHHRPYT